MIASDETRVTVVIPCHDDGATIREAIESADELEAIRIVVVDDGSTDPATHRLLAELDEGSAVSVVRHAANQGVAEARNSGVRAATTPYVFLLDADDRLIPRSLALLADRLDAAPDASVAWGGYRFFGGRSGSVRVPSWDPWRLTFNNYWPGVALVRRTEYLSLGGQSPRSRYEDWDLWMSLAERGGHGVVVDAVVFEYRAALLSDRRCGSSLDHFWDERRILVRAHPRLFECRGQLRRASDASMWMRMGERILLGAKLLLPAALRRLAYRMAARRNFHPLASIETETPGHA